MRKILNNMTTGLTNLSRALFNGDIAKFIEARKKQREREIFKHFKIEITSGFWGPKVKAIQRDRPLTDKELADLGY